MRQNLWERIERFKKDCIKLVGSSNNAASFFCRNFHFFVVFYYYRGRWFLLKEITTKQKVTQAASSLFFQKGFDGTSVRDIAYKADVNVSLISYYFKSKQGLLEHAVIHYYESYLEMMEENIIAYEKKEALDSLKHLIYKMIEFRLEQFQFSAFIHRELLLDSTFVREMSVTYLAKENHLLSNIFYTFLPEEKKKNRRFLYMQLKGMMMSPFSQKIEWDTTLFDQFGRTQFVKQYVSVIESWLDYLKMIE